MNKKYDVIGYFFGPTIFASDNSGCVDIVGRTNQKTLIDSIVDGTTRGLSPEIKIKWYQCTICLKNHEICPHDVGVTYSGKFCGLIPRDIEMICQSVVNVPKDPKARVTDLLIVEKKDSQTIFTWHGFESDKESRRFKHIQKASDSKLITEKVALKFTNFFMDSFLGVTHYP